jgi:ketosteroid isomerase-like protein
MKSSNGVVVVFAGTFSAGQATGTLQATGKLPCDAPEIKTTWSAQNTSVTVAPTKPAATIPAAPTKSLAPQPTAPTNASDPKSVLEAFFAAVNSKNVDAALAHAEDSLIFDIGAANGIGKDDLRASLMALNARNITFTMSNPRVVGNTIINFTAQASDGTVYKNSSAILTKGKISILTIK